MKAAFVTVIALYLLALFALTFFIRRRIEGAEDYIVAGRKLPFSLSTATLLATWFGAGTLLVAADEVNREGLRVASLEPVGPGLCLVIAGLFYAGPLWSAKLLTVSDLVRRRFGRVAEIISVGYEISFFAWIAAQLVAVAGILELFIGLPQSAGICIVALVSMLYTLAGGMWSVTLTDALQMLLIGIGLITLGAVVWIELGSGDTLTAIERLRAETPPKLFVFMPRDDLREFFQWCSLLVAGTIGIIPGQDLMQRVFAARSRRVAIGACLTGGVLYLLLGSLPVFLGLAARTLLPAAHEQVIPALAQAFLSTPMAILFILMVVSAVMSSLDSALLAPSSIVAQNLLRPWLSERWSTLLLTRLCVVFVAAISVLMALAGDDKFALLEASYSFNLPLLVVLTACIYQKRTVSAPAIATLTFGLVAWAFELVWSMSAERDIEEIVRVPFPLLVLGGSIVLYWAAHVWCRDRHG